MRRSLLIGPLAVLALTACAGTTDPLPAPTPTPSPSLSPSPEPVPTPSPSDSPEPSLTPVETSRPPAPRPSPAPPSSPAAPVSPSPIATASLKPSAAPPTAASGEWKDVESSATSAEQAAALAGVSDSFRSYVAKALSGPDQDGCTASEIGVASVHPAGFVLGTEAGDCGGGQVIWGQQGGGWERLFLLQAMPLCEELESAGIPAGIGIQCLDGENVVGF